MQDILGTILSFVPDVYDRANLMAVSREWYEMTLPYRARNMSFPINNTLKLPLMKHINPYSRHIRIAEIIRDRIAANNKYDVNISCKDDMYLICIYLATILASKDLPVIILINNKEISNYINLLKQCGLYVKGDIKSKVFASNDRAQMAHVGQLAANGSKRDNILLINSTALARIDNNYIRGGLLINMCGHACSMEQLHIYIYNEINQRRNELLTYNIGHTPQINEVVFAKRYTYQDIVDLIESLMILELVPQNIHVIKYNKLNNVSENIKLNFRINDTIYPDIIIYVNGRLTRNDMRLIKATEPNKVINCYYVCTSDDKYIRNHVFIDYESNINLMHAVMRVLYIDIYRLTDSDIEFMRSAVKHAGVKAYDDTYSITREQYDAILQL